MSSLNEVTDLITKFGAQILNKKGGDAPKVPQLKIAAADIIPLFKNVKNDSASEYDTGFFNIIQSYIAQSWTSLSGAQKEEIKNLLLNSAKTQINKHSLHSFANICATVYDLCEKEWPQIIDLVFNEKPSDTTAKIFIRFLATASEEFLQANFAKIVHFITVSFSIVSNSIKENYFTVLSSLNSEEAFSIEPTLLDIFMTNLINLVKEDPERQEFVVQTAIEVLIQAPKADSVVPKAFTDALANVKDTESAMPLLSIFPVFNSQAVVALLSRLVLVCENYIKENGALPMELLDAIERSPIEDLSEDVLETLAKFFSESLEKPGNTAAISIFAPLCAQVADVYGDKKMPQVIDGCFQGSGLSIVASLLIYKYIIGYMDNLEFKLPQSSLTRVFNLMASPDEKVRAAALDTARSLIREHFQPSSDSVAQLFKVFEVLPSEKEVRGFFKLLRDMFRAENENITNQAYEFALNGLKNTKDARMISEYLSIIANAADITPDLIAEEENEPILAKCIELLNSNNESTWKYASRAMLVLDADEEIQKKIISTLPRIKQLLSEKSTVSAKARGNLAASYAGLVIGNDMKDEYNNLVDVATRFIQSDNSHLITAGALLIEMSAQKLLPSVIRKVFESEVSVALEQSNEEPLNNLLHSMIECFDKFRCEPQQVENLFTSLSSGAHPVYKGKHFSSFVDKDTTIFAFLKVISNKFKEFYPKLVSPMVSWFSTAPSEMFDPLLDIITTLVGAKQVNGDDADLLGETLYKRIGAVHDDTLDEVMLGTLLDLIETKPDCIDAYRFCAKLVNIYEKLDEEEQPSLRACVAATILSLASTSEKVFEVVGDDLLKDILAGFPGEPGDGNADVMGMAVVKMVEAGDMFKDMRPSIAATLIRVLMLKNEELKKFEFRNQTVNAMKKVTKQILKENPEIERAIVKDFGKDRPMLNRFKKLFQ